MSVTSRQVGEIEEQLTSARRELARSEEANQKLQRDVKEVRPAELLTDSNPSLCVSLSRSGTKQTILLILTEICGNKTICLLGSTLLYVDEELLIINVPVAD